MPKEKPQCLEEYIAGLERQLQGSKSTLPDGPIEATVIYCNVANCLRYCALGGRVEKGKVVQVDTNFGGDPCAEKVGKT